MQSQQQSRPLTKEQLEKAKKIQAAKDKAVKDKKTIIK